MSVVRSWLGSWRISLRLARRDIKRGKLRSLLVIAIVAAPIAGIGAMQTYQAATTTDAMYHRQQLARFGTTGEAIVSINADGPIDQSWDGSGVGAKGNMNGPSLPTTADILAKLPAGSRLVSGGTNTSSVIETDSHAVVTYARIQDVRDSMLAGLWKVKSGRLPATNTEILLGTGIAGQLDVGVGSTVRMTAVGATQSSNFTVVGIGRTQRSTDTAVVLPSTSFTSTKSQGMVEYYVDSLQPITWKMVRSLNAIGVSVVSKYVLENPPAFCPSLNALCLDSGPASTQDWGYNAPKVITPQELAMATVLGLLAIIQVALIAGPAFAVQLRRRQRELGLIGANGADPATMRRTVLASGVLLGLIGAALGATIAWTSVWLLGGAFSFQPLAEIAGAELGVPRVTPMIGYLGLVGLLSATAAAAIPAFSAGRSDIVMSLRGRRPLPPIRARVPMIALLVVAAGLAFLIYGVAQTDAIIIGIGLVAAELGFIMFMPAIVVLASKFANLLPLAGRLAVRDASRHRMRTAAAACAIGAAAAGATALGVWSHAADLKADASGVPFVRGAAVSQIWAGVGEDGTALPLQPLFERAVAAAKSAVPHSTIAAITDLVPKPADTSEKAPPARFDCPPSLNPDHYGISACQADIESGISMSGVILLRDPATIGALLGPLAPLADAEKALREGKALVLVDGVLNADGNSVTLGVTSFDDQGQPISGEPVSFKAMRITTGAKPAGIIVGPAMVEAGGSAYGKALSFMDAINTTNYSASLIVVPDATDNNITSPVNRLNVTMIKNGVDSTFYNGQPSRPILNTGFETGSLATLLIAIFASFIVTALAQADAKGDLQTLAAIGAQPALRRRIAGNSAGFVTSVGSVVGVAAGLVASFVLIPIVVDGPVSLFRLPLDTVATVLVPVPLATAVMAWLFTRSQVRLSRRLD